MISCTFAGLARSTRCSTTLPIRTIFDGTSLGEFVIMAVLGGMRSFWLSIGAVIFVVLQDYVSSMTHNWMSYIGLFFVLIVLFFPRACWGSSAGRDPPAPLKSII